MDQLAFSLDWHDMERLCNFYMVNMAAPRSSAPAVGFEDHIGRLRFGRGAPDSPHATARNTAELAARELYELYVRVATEWNVWERAAAAERHTVAALVAELLDAVLAAEAPLR